MWSRLLLVVPFVLLATGNVASGLPEDEPRPASPVAPEKRLADARVLVKAGKAAEAKKVLAGLVESDPKNREARKALLEAAALTKDWEQCNAQSAALEPFAEGEEVYMFYAAVALRETGSVATARALVKRARPWLVSSAFVEYYTKEILGN
jgi:lipopolysaccharide biosynthesis regulator YciM